MKTELGTKVLELIKLGNVADCKDFVRNNYTDSAWMCVVHSKSGDTLMSYAARYGHDALLKWLHEESHLSLNVSNYDGKRPLHEAAQAGHLDCVNYLISRNVDIDAIKRADWTPLMLACTKSNIGVIRVLLESGADPRLRNKDGWNSLHLACREGHSEIVNLLLDYDGQLWNVKSNNSRTPLHTAAFHGSNDVVKILLERGCYEGDVIDSCGTTPLMDALRMGHVNVAEILISRHKSSLLVRDNIGRQCLHLACESCAIASVKYMLEQHGTIIDVNIKSSISGVTPLHLACREGHAEIVSLLLTYGADINIKDFQGRSAWYFANRGRHKNCLQLLNENGCKSSVDNVS